MDYTTIREQNRRSWNAVVPAHASHRPGLAAFLRSGGSTLFPEELELLGDVAGRSLLHLLCNAGQDTLSLAALGARATGVDLSDAAVARALALSAESGIPARFVCADVYDYLAEAAGAGFARIYCGYGAICWLHDLAAFARGVAAALAPGGRFALVEFHPVANMFDPSWRLTADYPQGGALLTLDGVGDYVGAAGEGLAPGGYAEGVRDFANPHACHLFRWGVGEVVSALASAGLAIVALREYPFVNGERPFERMRSEGRRRYPPAELPAIPLMYGLAAERPV
ncbi:MAG: class I SAM-dependent methyltransferase [Chloroflexi bacterium OHK40]